jgi:hypothetical protein
VLPLVCGARTPGSQLVSLRAASSSCFDGIIVATVRSGVGISTRNGFVGISTTPLRGGAPEPRTLRRTAGRSLRKAPQWEAASTLREPAKFPHCVKLWGFPRRSAPPGCTGDFQWQRARCQGDWGQRGATGARGYMEANRCVCVPIRECVNKIMRAQPGGRRRQPTRARTSLNAIIPYALAGFRLLCGGPGGR